MEANVRRGTLVVAQVLYTFFSTTFYPLGWMPAVHGSVLIDGIGRDIDFVFVRTHVLAIPVDELKERLRLLGLESLKHEMRGELEGIYGVMHGYAVDITLVS